MSSLHDRIAQFRKMATDDPDNELGHFRLGQLLMEAGQYADALPCFDRTLELSPQFSKVYQLLAECQAKEGDNDKAVETLTKGYAVADERGDRMPRDAMARMLQDLGAPVPKPEVAAVADDGPDTGFRCQRPGCLAGRRAKPLTEAPKLGGALADQIKETVCHDCWESWKKDYSIKVINELRLDLSSESGAAEYDKYLRGFLGLDEETAEKVRNLPT